jgi:colanic acid/amylovoran biosynthesis glycosyltransferase
MRDGLNSLRAASSPPLDAGEKEAEPARPLRIAMFVNEFPALSETFVLNQITGLLQLGHDVTIFATQARAEAGVHADVMRYGLHERLVYRGMPAARLARLAVVPAILARGGARPRAFIRALDPLRYGREATSLNMLYWTDRLISQRPFDIIHCHFGIVGRVAAYLREIGAVEGKLVTVFHGVDMSTCLDRDPDLYRHLFEHGDLFQPVSEHWRRKLIAHGCDPRRIVVHRMGIDVARFPLTVRRPGAERMRILTIGRLVEKKGIEFGLRAVAQLVGQGLPLRYEIVGDGPLRTSLEELACDLGIAGNVVFRGSLVQKEVRRAMQASDILLAPSVTDAEGDQEGIPVTIMEAMATGMPVVSSLHSGIPELVEDRVSGLLAAERDVEGLANAIASLCVSPERCQEMGVAARAKVVAEYNIDTLNLQLVQTYRALG